MGVQVPSSALLTGYPRIPFTFCNSFYSEALNISIQETDTPLQPLIHIEVAVEDYIDRVRKAILDIAKKAQMPGFRPGKVPTGMIRKMYGAEVLREQMNKILQENLDQYLTNEKIKLLGYPLPVPVDFQLDLDANQTYKFSFEIGRSPEFELNTNISGLKKYKVELDEAYLDREIEMLKNRFGKMTTAEVGQEGDTIFGKMEEVDSEGKVIPNGKSHTITLNPGLFDQAPSKGFPAGVKIGDVIPFDVEKVMNGSRKRSMLMQMSLPRYLREGKGKKFQFIVNKINHFEPAELNEELFKNVFGEKDTPNTIEAFREKLKESVLEFLNEETAKLLYIHIQQAFVDTHNLQLPDGFLKKWLLMQEEQKRTAEQIEQDYPEWSWGLKWNLIQNAIISQYEDLRITEAEIKEEARAKALKMFGDLDESQAEAFIPYFLQNEQSYNQISDDLQNRKLTDKFMEILTIQETPVTASAFDQV